MPIATAISAPDTGTPTDSTTASILGDFRRELLTEGLHAQLVDDILRHAAAEIVPHGIVLKAGQA